MACQTRVIMRHMATLIVMAAMLASLHGCDRGETRSAAEIRDDVVASLLKGMKRQGSQLSAERYDSVAGELRALRVTGKEGLLYAERATISVDEVTRAVRLKLFDVVLTQPSGEDAAPEGTQGQIIRYREMVLDDLSAPPKQ